jgi:acetate kinase
MKIIILNCGSSSIKYQLVEMPGAKVIAKGLVEKVGLKDSVIKHKNDAGTDLKLEMPIPDHQNGIEEVLRILVSPKNGSLKS